MPADKTMSAHHQAASFPQAPCRISWRLEASRLVTRRQTFVLVGLFCVLCLSSARAEMTDAQKRMANNLKTAVDQAADLFKQEKYSEAASELKRAQKILDNLNKKPDADVLKQIDKSYRRMKKAHDLLTAKGQSLDPLKELPTPPPASAKKDSTGDEDDEEQEGDREEETESDESRENDEATDEESGEKSREERRGRNSKRETSTRKTTRAKTTKKAPKSKEEDIEEISFTSVVAPILVQHCGRCHIDGDRGEYSMASYQTLMDGSSLVAKEPDASPMLQMIESGDMPPRRGGRGQPVPEEDVKKIRDWITQGAKFDGSDAEANLKEL